MVHTVLTLWLGALLQKYMKRWVALSLRALTAGQNV